MVYVLASLIVIDLLALAATTVSGLTMDSVEAVREHVTAGIFTSSVCCATHVLVMFYLIGTGKDVRDAVEDDLELTARYVPWTRLLKRQVFPWATLATIFTIVAALLGGEVHSRVIIATHTRDVLPLREVGGWWIHLGLVLLAVCLNLAAFRAELRTVRENRRGIKEINLELASRGASS